MKMKIDKVSDRPAISVPLELIDYVIICLSVFIFMFMVVYTIVVWKKLPDIIPTNFDFSGKIKGYDSKSTLFVMLPVMFFITSLMTVLSRFPRIFGYMVTITKENAYQQYQAASRFLIILGLEMSVMFSVIQIMILVGAQTTHLPPVSYFVPVMMAAIFGTIIWYIMSSMKSK